MICKKPPFHQIDFTVQINFTVQIDFTIQTKINPSDENPNVWNVKIKVFTPVISALFIPLSVYLDLEEVKAEGFTVDTTRLTNPLRRELFSGEKTVEVGGDRRDVLRLLFHFSDFGTGKREEKILPVRHTVVSLHFT